MGRFANKYNKGSKFTFKTTEGFKYHNLEELFNSFGKKKIYTVRAMYINSKSAYGDAPVVATDEFYVNLPTHLLDTVREMLQDDELIDAINNSEFGFIIEPYSKRDRVLYGVQWVDIEND